MSEENKTEDMSKEEVTSPAETDTDEYEKFAASVTDQRVRRAR